MKRYEIRRDEQLAFPWAVVQTSTERTVKHFMTYAEARRTADLLDVELDRLPFPSQLRLIFRIGKTGGPLTFVDTDLVGVPHLDYRQLVVSLPDFDEYRAQLDQLHDGSYGAEQGLQEAVDDAS